MYILICEKKDTRDRNEGIYSGRRLVVDFSNSHLSNPMMDYTMNYGFSAIHGDFHCQDQESEPPVVLSTLESKYLSLSA